MERIRVKELIEFNRRSDKSKKSYAQKLKNRKPKEKTEVESEGGGDYWVTSTSSIYNVAKYGLKEVYDDKIKELYSRFDNTEDKRIKTMYQRNIDILNSFNEIDLNEIKPNTECNFQSVSKELKILEINSIPIFVNPNLLFSFEYEDKKQIGAIWLVPQLNGFNKIDLAFFCEILYRFLIKNYGTQYQVSDKHCIIIDTFNAQIINYLDLINLNIPLIIDKTLKELKEL